MKYPPEPSKTVKKTIKYYGMFNKDNCLGLSWSEYDEMDAEIIDNMLLFQGCINEKQNKENDKINKKRK